jgi:hypothetical protein
MEQIDTSFKAQSQSGQNGHVSTVSKDVEKL